MENKYYPVFLDLEGRKVLIVGGGAVAAQKVSTLLRCKAQLTVVAKRADADFYRWHKAGKIELHLRAFKTSDLNGAWLVFCATDDSVLNARVFRLGRKRGLWVNVVDCPPLCDFIVPAVAVQGPLAAAISSGGSSPVLARYLRDQVQEILQPHLALLAQVLQKERAHLKKFPMQQRKTMLEKILSWEEIRKLRGKSETQILSWLRAQLRKQFGVELDRP